MHSDAGAGIEGQLHVEPIHFGFKSLYRPQCPCSHGKEEAEGCKSLLLPLLLLLL